MGNEIWKPVVGFEGLYEVSNMGRVRNRMGRIMTLSFNRNGYHRVHLINNSREKFMLVHRLVSMAFIPNPENKPFVNHLNGIKTDNKVENLEWCTSSENMQHAVKVLHKKFRTKPVICVETGKRFNSIKEADGYLGYLGKGHIGDCCKGTRQTAGGYHWRYTDE